ncbi:APC family permease [Micromonospora chaiyaphumensis]|uniref:Amino acid/polyamine/organocation transporter, APC superfamily (TC 2.A.3) n=1 Tax=Micromonospora chaiyaphumensis TaxID=307119 RepID=A0A1C4W7Q0_9ACTN|nr:APC family permease [Micromonospora chaiyaphumensis]SCE92139.1 amino acid/polyamine/organocation transporter, APC superfamily (TC 2.A.3) [Micromonospora chaiyaphumensis]
MPRHDPDTVSAVLTRGRLGIPAVVFFVVAAAAPLTAVAGGATTGYAVTGVLGIPLAYLVVAAVLALFAVGYVAMSRRIVNAGAFYTYVTRGLGRPAGVAAAIVALVAYNSMQIGLYGVFGAVLSGLLNDRFGMNTTRWLCAVIACAVIAVLGLLRIDLNGRVLAVLLVAECVIALVYDAVMVARPVNDLGVSFDTLAPGNLIGPGIGAALVTGIAGFVGFEGTTVFAEETKDPKRTVPRATYIAVAVTALLYGLSAWAMSVATGPDQIVAAAQTEGTDLIFNLVSPHLTSSLVTLGRWLFITSLFAALLSFHHTVARYAFALGRERVLPSVLGRTSRRTGAPKAGSILQTALAVAVLTGYVLADADPIVHLFFWLTSLGALGVLILMTATSVAVLSYFARIAHRDGMWRTAVAPFLSALALGAILVVTVEQFDALLGVEPTSPLRWVFPASYAVAAATGLAWAFTLRAARPDVYQTIGLGADSATAPLRTPDPVRQPV